MRMVPRYSDHAKEQLRVLGRVRATLLEDSLQRKLGPGSWNIRQLPIRHKPPWFLLALDAEYFAVIRRLTGKEESWSGPSTVEVLVAMLLTGSEVETLKTELLARTKFLDAPDED